MITPVKTPINTRRSTFVALLRCPFVSFAFLRFLCFAWYHPPPWGRVCHEGSQTVRCCRRAGDGVCRTARGERPADETPADADHQRDADRVRLRQQHLDGGPR